MIDKSQKSDAPPRSLQFLSITGKTNTGCVLFIPSSYPQNFTPTSCSTIAGVKCDMEWGCPELFFPPELVGVPLEMGIDETGRGAVLGSMVYCGAFAQVGFTWPNSVRDSKQLSSEKRDSILSEFQSLPIGFVHRAVSAAEISATMFSRSNSNLNSLSHNTARQLVQTVINAGLRVEFLYVDTVGDPTFYERFLSRAFPSIHIVVTEKADSQFKVVGAASIKAKVIRDRLLATFEFEESDLLPTRTFGSGYPGDSITVKWLEENFDPVFGYPSIARFSWNPVADAFKKHNAQADFDGNDIRTPQIDSAFFIQRKIRIARIV
jgi:ribonuclease H2 subunit A